MYSLSWGGGPGPWPFDWRSRGSASNRSGARRPTRANGAAAGRAGSYFERVQGFNGPLKAAMTSGSLSAAGDVLAQFVTGREAQAQGKAAAAYDPLRTLRMLGFGAAWYGPYQFYWYNLLDFLMPARSTPNFLAKVALNQLALAPVTLAAVFTWNLALTGQAAGIAGKIKADLVPSMINGWKFWVPAASLNFYAVPVRHQVLYMSCCGMLWTAYLSYISAAIKPPAQPVLAPAGGRAKRR